MADIESFNAATDMTSNQFRAVRMSTGADFRVQAISSQKQRPVGWQASKPNSTGTEAIAVALPPLRVKSVVGSGGITRGDLLKMDSGGRVVTAGGYNNSAATSEWIVGDALQSISSGAIGYIQLRTPAQVAT